MTLPALDPAFSNTQTFIPALFDPDIRSAAAVQPFIAKGELDCAFQTADSASLLMNSWLAAWQSAQGDLPADGEAAYNRCPLQDRQLIAFISNYIKGNPFSLCIPTLSLNGFNGEGLAVYRNSGYVRHPFTTNGRWDYGTGEAGTGAVSTFLSLLMSGAHMVVINQSSDLGGDKSVPSFLSDFSDTKKNGLTISNDPGNSHYTAGTNTNGKYYLKINDDKEPPTDPLICAFLACSTSAWIGKNDNTFIQMEGWQATIVGPNKWHMADYAAYNATLWNFSTYGACPYSEKRSTPVFIATSDFSLECDQETGMPLYDGAGSLQDWMNPALVVLS